MDEEIKKRIKILSRFLGVPKSDIKCHSNKYARGITVFEVELPSETANGLVEEGSPVYREYAVFEEPELDDAIADKIEDMVLDKGLDAFRDDKEVYDYFLDEGLDWEWFEDDAKDYANDLASEMHDDDLNGFLDFCIDRYFIDEDDIDEETGDYEGDLDLEGMLAEAFFEEYSDEYNGNFFEWCLDNHYDKDDINELIKTGAIEVCASDLADTIISHIGYRWFNEDYEVTDNGYYIILMDEYS